MSLSTPTNNSNEVTSTASKNEETPSPNLIIFPWTLRWLKGNEYFHLIQNYQLYQEFLSFDVLSQHPDEIYIHPQSIILVKIC